MQAGLSTVQVALRTVQMGLRTVQVEIEHSAGGCEHGAGGSAHSAGGCAQNLDGKKERATEMGGPLQERECGGSRSGEDPCEGAELDGIMAAELDHEAYKSESIYLTHQRNLLRNAMWGFMQQLNAAADVAFINDPREKGAF